MPHITLIKQWDSRLVGPRTRVTTDDARGVVEVHLVVCGVIHSCQTRSMLHITLIKQWDSMSIIVSLPLDRYMISEVHGSSSWEEQLGMSGV